MIGAKSGCELARGLRGREGYRVLVCQVLVAISVTIG
jgi:hypothetical protein